MVLDSEAADLIPTVKVYKRRWYILALFSLATATQGGIWSTWGPISKSAEVAFNWTQSDIALLTSWGPIAYLISAPFLVWFMQFGLRYSQLALTGVMTLGTMLRCINSNPPTFTYLAYSGQIINGLVGPIAMSLSPLLSVIWFPLEERTLATAISAVLNSAGTAASFLTGPLSIADPSKSNSTSPLEIRKEIMYNMYAACGWTALLFLLSICYFPSKPMIPPTASASSGIRRSFLKGLIMLIKKDSLRFWLLAFPYGLSIGFFAAWTSVLDDIIPKHHLSEDAAGWLAFIGTISGQVAGLLMAKLADRFPNRMKEFLLSSYVIASVCCLLFCFNLVLWKFNVIVLYSSFILAAICISSTVPLWIEMMSETAFPVDESSATGVATTINNATAAILLGILSKQSLGVNWTSWAVLSSAVISIPFIIVFKPKDSRRFLDTA
ncbi:unnamed protein product [Dimorphilus gyrociliatus]|uniref:Major facilitator superfamily (MFS) profile domain-containing protein n=1 Tax=Dimorphilus gyrociliatus TaxID=2664684 RepID=A0A7I8VG22_9ANNE|nr:unnamed protein product [Dimorphilus gyrociliatus]